MTSKFRKFILSLFISLSLIPATFLSANALTFTMATSGSETDMRSVAIVNVFAPMVSDFADMQIGYNSTMFDQGTELDAISRGNLTMSIASAQELAQFFPEFSIFATGYVHQDAAHQVRVFNDPLMDSFKKTAEDKLGVKLLSVMYLGKRHVNLRQTKDELTVNTPADLAGVNTLTTALPRPINFSNWIPSKVPAAKPKAYAAIKKGSLISLITWETARIQIADSINPMKAPRTGFFVTTKALTVVKDWSISLNTKINSADRNRFMFAVKLILVLSKIRWFYNAFSFKFVFLFT